MSERWIFRIEIFFGIIVMLYSFCGWYVMLRYGMITVEIDIDKYDYINLTS